MLGQPTVFPLQLLPKMGQVFNGAPEMMALMGQL
jgi:hypothetical protein